MTRPGAARAKARPTAALLILAALAACAAPAAKRAPAAVAPRDALGTERIEPLLAYIDKAWRPLTRTAADLPRAAADPKVPHTAGTPWPVYLSPDENPAAVAAELARALPARELARIALRPLPRELPPDFEHGLLYLPRPYVVPGGRFNEMYGWDSYFIVVGLLRDERAALARSVVDDFLYEVRHYGGVLNANRTYYLTRSQPPLLAEMVVAVYHATGDRAWLAGARDALVTVYDHWLAPPHLIPSIGLSRYFDHGEGPAPEVVAGERDAAGANHYDRVRAWFRANPAAAAGYYSAESDELTPLFYKGDRSMRESGFDPTGRFGPFGADVTRYAPVCLNALLYRMERDLAEIDQALGQGGKNAKDWLALAEARKARIEALLWDDAAGLYFDYDFESGRRNPYPFATTFWPLWAGVASRAHATRVRGNLPLFERPGGIVTSTTVTGAQWDAPFGWAPLQLFAVHGLHRYGFDVDADRIARAWLSMLVEDFERRGTLVEKYDVERRTSDVAGKLAFGYTSNEIGFGWTNGVALELLAGLSR